jgi:hypothetical protein
MRPNVGFSPTAPFQLAGSLTEPPISLPKFTGEYPAADAVPAPALDPPGFQSAFQALHVVGWSVETPDDSMPHSGMAVFPSVMHPVALSRS